MDNYYKELPENYEKYYEIDAKNNKIGIILNVVALVLTIASILPFVFIYDFKIEVNLYTALMLLILAVSLVVYMILHELVHGLVYKLLTHEKLTFGLTLTVAFCGVPNIYVSKKTALLAVYAPFVVFTITFLLCIFLIPDLTIKLLFVILFGLHFGGCIGDLYVGFLLLKSKGNILMNDTGPKQTFYKEVL